MPLAVRSQLERDFKLKLRLLRVTASDTQAGPPGNLKLVVLASSCSTAARRLPASLRLQAAPGRATAVSQ